MYRIRQEKGGWFYPQYKGLFCWRYYKTFDGFGSYNVSFGTETKAKAFLKEKAEEYERDRWLPKTVAEYGRFDILDQFKFLSKNKCTCHKSVPIYPCHLE